MSPNVPRSRSLSVFVVAAVLASATTAMAQPGAGRPAHAEAMADARFREGLRAYDKGDFDAARLDFLQAQAIYPRPSSLRNLALAELETKRPLDALQHLRAFIADVGTTPDRRALAERNVAEAYGKTGHLAISAPDGAHLTVDGKDVGVAPLKDAVDVEVGPHGVDMVGGPTTLHESVIAAAGKLTEVAFVPPVVAGNAHVVGIGPAVVAVAPPPVVRPGEPEHHGYWNGRRTVGVIIAGVGAVGMVVGGVFGAQRGSETSDANAALASITPRSLGACAPASASNASACSALTSARSSNSSDANIEGPMLVGGGVLLAVGLITAFWPSPSSPPPTALVPMAGPHLAGLSWSGSF
jgi:hypothetical protein